MMFKNILIAAVSLFLMSCALIPNTYQAAPISGTVIDKDTELPLAGVNVVVYWQLYTGGPGGRVPTTLLKVEETVTDENGGYHFKGWGPVTTFKGRLGYQAPELLFFKPGYYYQRKGNSRTEMHFGSRGAGEIHVPNAEETSNGLLYRSQWDGRNIELKKGSYSEKKYISNMENLSNDLGRLIEFNFNCEKKTYFRMIKQEQELIKELNNKNIRHFMSAPDTAPIVRDCKQLW